MNKLLTWHDKKLDFNRVFYEPTEDIPYPHRDGLASRDGIHLDLLIPKHVKREDIKLLLKKIRSERDLVSYSIFRGEPQ